jgi:peroxiredoxin
MDAQVLAVSTDFIATLSHWAGELKATYPLMSDHDGAVAAKYGVFMSDRRMANRATFVIGTDGKIREIVEGSAAIDPTGAETACSRVRKK